MLCSAQGKEASLGGLRISRNRKCSNTRNAEQDDYPPKQFVRTTEQVVDCFIRLRLLSLKGDMSCLEIDPFLLDHKRSFANLRVNRAYVFAQNSNEEQLHGGKKKQPDHERGHPDRETTPE